MAGRSNAKKVWLDGFVFDSGAEARRYQELRVMGSGGLIADLEVHPVYPIKVNGKLICKYVADFRYIERGYIAHNGKDTLVVEDVKGYPTEVFRIKHKLFEAVYKMKLLITPASDYPGPRARRGRVTRRR